MAGPKPLSYQDLWPSQRLRSLQDPTTALIYSALFIYCLVALSRYTGLGPILSIPDLLWDAVVFLTPPSVVLAFERPDASQSPTGIRSLQTYAESRTFAAKRRALEQITGLGSGSQAPEGQPAGLRNISNSCFENSIIQALASLPSLERFLEFAQTEVPNQQDRKVTNELMNFFAKLNDPENSRRSFSVPRTLTKLDTWQQQDAHEYYSKIIDAVETEIGDSIKALGLRKPFGSDGTGLFTRTEIETALEIAKSSEDAPGDGRKGLIHPLEGLLAQRLGCLTCGYVEGLSLVPFTNLTLNLENADTGDIAACLDDYTKLDTGLEGVHCSKCTLHDFKKRLEEHLKQPPAEAADEAERARHEEQRKGLEARLEAIKAALERKDFSDSTIKEKCEIPEREFTKVTKSKQQVLARYPSSLVLHINRSRFHEGWGVMVKNHAVVRFPMHLDVGRWSIGGTQVPEEMWKTNPHQSMLEQAASAPASAAAAGSAYVLRSVVEHTGTHDGGHYESLRQTPLQHVSDGEGKKAARGWWSLSDTRISAACEDTVLRQGNVFMLFYEQLSARELHEHRSRQPAGTPRDPDRPLPSVEADERPSLPATPRRPTSVLLGTPPSQLVPQRTTSLPATASPATPRTRKRVQTAEPRPVSELSPSPARTRVISFAHVGESEPGPQPARSVSPGGVQAGAEAGLAAPRGLASPAPPARSSGAPSLRDSAASALTTTPRVPPPIPARAASLPAGAGRGGRSGASSKKNHLSSSLFAPNPDAAKAEQAQAAVAT